MTDLSARPNPVSTLPTALLITIPGVILLGIWQPQCPDLFAQLARTSLSKVSDGSDWWTSWYGGITTPSYSVIAPALMQDIGVWTAGILATVITVVMAARILAGHHRARLATTLVAVGLLTNLASGRMTFAVGLAFASISYWSATNPGRRHLALAATCGALATLGSPLAGLFLVMILAATGAGTRDLTKIWVIAPTLVTGAIVQFGFHLPGVMPMRWGHLLLGTGVAAVLWAAHSHRSWRTFSALYLLAIWGAFLIPTALGSNIIRLPLLLLAPAIATSTRLTGMKLAAAIAPLFLWNGYLTVVDLERSAHPDTNERFYTPLLAQLPASVTNNYRVEVVDPITHSPAYYVAGTTPLARGWERQVDVIRNPLFYNDSLDASNYRRWLDDMAVRWVALPNTPLDNSSHREAKLIQDGLPYLNLVWQNEDWKLFAVQNPQPIVDGVAQLERVTPNSLVVSATTAGTGTLKASWTRGLTLRNTDPSRPGGTVIRTGDRISYTVPGAGTYILGTSPET